MRNQLGSPRFISSLMAFKKPGEAGAAPILMLIAIIGVVAFLAISYSAPFRNKLLSSLFPKDFSFAAGSAAINPSLGAPTNLILTGLDSTIRANWTAPTDPNAAWQVFSVWDGNKLIGTKILSKTANVADGNGLESSKQFTIKVQSMDSGGQLS